MRTTLLITAAVALVVAALVVGTASSGIADDVFTVHNLVADTAGSAPATDASLVNGWGLSAGPTTPWWVSNNGDEHVDALQRQRRKAGAHGLGARRADRHGVQRRPRRTSSSARTASRAAARFLFATEGGTILGWSPTVNGTARDSRRRPLGERARSTRA